MRGAPLTVMQWPAFEVSAQYWHAPVQPPSQQTPSAQKPLTHSRVAEQDCPLVFLGVQTPELQRPLTQSPSAVQVLPLQAVPEAQTTPPPQAVVVLGVTQLPAPSQAGAARSWPPLHEVLPQLTVLDWNRQPPLPSQVPSWPQAAASTAQAPLDEPPLLTGRQVPVV